MREAEARNRALRNVMSAGPTRVERGDQDQKNWSYYSSNRSPILSAPWNLDSTARMPPRIRKWW